MRILVTGGSGMLGSELLRQISGEGHVGVSLDRVGFLASDKIQRQSMLDGFDVVIHAAANTNVEQCEIEPEVCYFDNVFLTEKLFNHSQINKNRFVYISSTGVYGRGSSVPYHEYDVPQPTTVHHHSKLLSEKVVLASPNSLVIRTGWLFGGALSNTKNFINNRINEIRVATEFISANYMQVGSPTYVGDCARRILELISADSAGIYNVVNEGAASRFEYVKRIVELSGAAIEVRPIDASAFNRRADVSENEAAVSYRTKFDGLSPLRPWQDALDDYMSQFGLRSCLSQRT